MRSQVYCFKSIMILLAIIIIFMGCNKVESNPSITESVEDVELVDEGEAVEEDEAAKKDEAVKKDETVETMPTNIEKEIIPMHMGILDIQKEVIYEENFEGGSLSYQGRAEAAVELSKEHSHEGEYSLYTTGRKASWHGPIIDITNLVKKNTSYSISAYIMYMDGPDEMEMDCQVEINGNLYLNFGSAMVKKGEWIKLEGYLHLPETMNRAQLYFESHYGTESETFISFYVDAITLSKETVIAQRGELPSLKEVYKDYFTIGYASTVSESPVSIHPLLKEQFNSLTIGNELKPDSVLDYETCISDSKYNDNPAVHFKNASYLLDFAMENQIPVRGHTLVWHSQTPRWFFTEGYSTKADAPLVDRELMLTRMENYIKNVLEYAKTHYPDLIYAWDVVNEAIEVSDGNENWIRSTDNNWYATVGEDYAEKAFEYARKYADSDILLFYNDYNTEDPKKVIGICHLVDKLKQRGHIDGIGLQNHIGMDSPSLNAIESSIRKYAEFGLEIHITELDVFLTDNSEEALMKQASRYKRFFTLIRHLKKSEAANITNVTFWGITDATSWLNKPGVPNYPLLFDKYGIQKPAFWGAVMSKDVPLN